MATWHANVMCTGACKPVEIRMEGEPCWIRPRGQQEADGKISSRTCSAHLQFPSRQHTKSLMPRALPGSSSPPPKMCCITFRASLTVEERSAVPPQNSTGARRAWVHQSQWASWYKIIWQVPITAKPHFLMWTMRSCKHLEGKRLHPITEDLLTAATNSWILHFWIFCPVYSLPASNGFLT